MKEDVPTSSPTNFLVTVLNSTNVQIDWNPPPTSEQNGVISSYNLSVTDAITEETLTLTLTSSETSVNFGELLPYTTYYCAVAAYTSVGAGPYTSLVYFETDEAAPSSPPEDVTIHDISSTGIGLSWSEPEEESINGIIRSYEVELLEIDTGSVITQTTTNTEITVTLLHPYYRYNVSVAAVTVGKGPSSSPLSVTTAEAAPSAAPTSLTVSIVNSTALNVSWELPPADKINGIIQYYSVRVQETDTTETIHHQTSKSFILLKELHPYYTYTVFVAAVTVSIGPYSVGNSVQTPADIPSGPPQNVTGSVISSSKIEVSWSPPEASLQNGPVQSYTIIVFEVDTNATVQNHTDFLHNTIILTNLHPNYNYHITVAAYTVGLGPSTNVQLSTLEDVPSGPPKNIQVALTSSTTATLQWTEPNYEDQNGNIQHYRVTVSGPDKYQTLTSSGLSIQLTGLHPYYSYTCSIHAVTIGSGPSGNITFTTPQDVPASAPSNLSTSFITSTGVQFSWSPLPAPDQNGIITEYVIMLSEVGSNEQWNLTSNTTSLSALAILSPHTTYESTVAAKTIVGLGPVSSKVSFTTKEDSPVSSPRQFSSSMITSTSFELSWIPPVEEDINGVVTGYIVLVTVSDTQESFTLNTTATNITLTGLHPFYTHTCSVTCVTVTEGPYSESINVKTLQDAPSSTVGSMSVTTPYSHTVSVTWNPPPSSDINGIITFYSVHFSIAETGETIEYKTDKTFFIITDAHPYYTYSVKVSAVTVAYGPYTPVITVTTPQDVPTGPPMNLTAVVLNSTAVYVSWQPPLASEQNGVIQKYVVSVYEVANDEESIELEVVNSTSVIVADLHPYYNYDVSVLAFTIAAGPVTLESFTTDEDVPSSGPLNVSVSNITSTSVFIQWTPPPTDQHNGVIRHYTVTVHEIITNTYSSVNTSDQFVMIENLHPDYEYSVDISVVTIGPGPSSYTTFRLLEDVPSVSPKNISVVALNHTTLQVSWDPLEEQYHNGRIRFYKLLISDLQDNEFYLELSVNDSSSAIVTGLKPFHTYGVEIAAYTIGEGPYSTVVNTTLPQSVPSEPPAEFIEVLELQNLTAHFSWISPPADSINGILLGYKLSCAALNQHDVTVDVTGTSVALPPFSFQQETHYTCTVCAYTIVGCGLEAVVHISTYEGSPVGPPSSVMAGSVSSTKIDLSWSSPFDPDEVILGYGITYQLIETSLSIETPRPPVTVASESTEPAYTIGSLLPSSAYRIVVFAVFEEGTGPYSEGIVVTTTAVDLGSVRNYRCLSVSSDSLRCSWDDPEPIEGYFILSYQVAYRLAEGFDYYPGYGMELNRVDLSPLTNEYVINNLEPYAGYIIELKCVLSHDLGSGDFMMAEDEVDNITSYASVFNVTGPEIVDASVDNFRVEINSPTSVDVYWTPPPRITWNGRIESYNIVAERGSFITGETRRRREAHTDAIVVPPQANHGDPSLAVEPLSAETYRVNNLEENFAYQFSIIIVNSKGAGAPTTPVTQLMPESAPSGPPINITATDRTRSSITIQWSPPNPIEANGVILMYSLNFTRVSIRDSVVKEFLKNQLSYEQLGLQVFETVSVSVAAKTAVGWGPYSNLHYFNTLEDSPSSPVDLRYELTDNNDVVLEWKEPNTANGIITGYQIIYTGRIRSEQSTVSEGPFTKLVNSSSAERNQVTISDLVGDHIYEFKVRAINGAGYGENSTVAVFVPVSPGAGGSSGVEDSGTDFPMLTVIIAVSVASVIVILAIIVLVTVCVVRRGSRKSKSVDLHQVRESDSVVRNVGAETMELPMQTISAGAEPVRVEHNEYEHVTFSNFDPELPELKKPTNSLSSAVGDEESIDGGSEPSDEYEVVQYRTEKEEGAAGDDHDEENEKNEKNDWSFL